MADLIHNPPVLGAYLKKLRRSKDLTLQHVAERTSLSKSFVSMVESGLRQIRFHDLRQVLMCYGYSLGWFLSQTLDSGRFPTVHSVVQTRANGLLMDGSRKDHHYCLLLQRPLRSHTDIELVELTLPAQTQAPEHPLTLQAEMRGIVQRGTLLVLLQNDEYVVRQGEEFCFDGRIPHIFRNYTNQLSIVNCFVSPPML